MSLQIDVPKDSLCAVLHGAHLYGTDTPASDFDFKGVFLPSFRDLLLERAPKQRTVLSAKKLEGSEKNAPGEAEFLQYSIKKFLDLACNGETVAIDMLHAPENAVLYSTWEWDRIVQSRSRFYTKNMKSLIGYAARQAHKYGVRGSRLYAAKEALAVLEEELHKTRSDTYVEERVVRLQELRDRLPIGEHAKIVTLEGTNGRMEEYYELCGKRLQFTAPINLYAQMLRSFISEYGDRSKQAEKNQGVDWKALSHAYRAAYQVLHILRDGGFEYPMPETDILRDIKAGNIPFVKVSEGLEELIAYVKDLSESSTLPEHVDGSFWEEFLEEVYARHYHSWWR